MKKDLLLFRYVDLHLLLKFVNWHSQVFWHETHIKCILTGEISIYNPIEAIQ